MGRKLAVGNNAALRRAAFKAAKPKKILVAVLNGAPYRGAFFKDATSGA